MTCLDTVNVKMQYYTSMHAAVNNTSNEARNVPWGHNMITIHPGRASTPRVDLVDFVQVLNNQDTSVMEA